MKKIFTLIAMAFIAMGANAQESYLAIDDDGNLATEFANATTDEDGNKIVTINGTHVTMRGVSSGAPDDYKTDDEEIPYTSANWPFWKDPEWKKFNKSQKVWHWKDGVKTGVSDDQVVDFVFNAIWGTGNPVTGFDIERVEDNSGTYAYTYRAKYDGYYFDPATSTAAPARGEYFEFKADVDGLMKIGFGIANGTNRYVYVVEKETVKTLTAADFKVEGYVQGCDNIDGTPMWIPSLKINEDYTIGDTEFNQSYKDEELTTVNQVQKVKFAWIVLEAKAGTTYMLFTPTSQIAFRDYQFTPGAKLADYTADENGPVAPGVPTAISYVKAAPEYSTEGPLFNLAGQRVTKANKGLLIQNGKKVVKK